MTLKRISVRTTHTSETMIDTSAA